MHDRGPETTLNFLDPPIYTLITASTQLDSYSRTRTQIKYVIIIILLLLLLFMPMLLVYLWETQWGMIHLSHFVQSVCEQIPQLRWLAVHYLNIWPPWQTTLQNHTAPAYSLCHITAMWFCTFTK